MREIALDTETTGTDSKGSDRIVSIGCVEMENRIKTGKTFYKLINPERSVPKEAVAIHGLSDEILASKPKFWEIVDEFLEFIGNAPLVIHNAPFDMGFINKELKLAGKEPLPMTRAIDTLTMARKKYPGHQASLDKLCLKFGIDNSNRQIHGALLDADLLADVYDKMLADTTVVKEPTDIFSTLDIVNFSAQANQKKFREPRPHPQINEEETKTHLEALGRVKNCLWTQNNS